MDFQKRHVVAFYQRLYQERPFCGYALDGPDNQRLHASILRMVHGVLVSIGSSSWNRPASKRSSAAQEVISLVLENARNRWSLRSAMSCSLSAQPTQSRST